MNKPTSDFLCVSSSFLTGFGSVVNLGGQLYKYNTSDNPDEIAIANDWRMVGRDIRSALDQAKVKIPQIRNND